MMGEAGRDNILHWIEEELCHVVNLREVVGYGVMTVPIAAGAYGHAQEYAIDL